MPFPGHHFPSAFLGLLIGVTPALADSQLQSIHVGQVDESLFRDSEKVRPNWWRETQGDDKTSLTHFLAWISEELRQTIRYPTSARRQNQHGTVQISVSFSADGALSAIEIVENSGHDVLDREALRAIRAIDALRVPPEFRGNPVHAVVPIHFRLERRELPPSTSPATR